MQELILASSNAGKIKELEQLLSPIICLSQTSLGLVAIEETGETFIENALAKARSAAKLGKKAALADDSGLVVPALNGEPGIYSARYAGENASDEQNIALLLEKLKFLPKNKRQAYFYCAIVFLNYAADPIPLIAWGKIKGYINDEPLGENGFGYDPIFYLPEYKCTMAQLPAKVKSSISHRGQALAMLKELWQKNSTNSHD